MLLRRRGHQATSITTGSATSSCGVNLQLEQAVPADLSPDVLWHTMPCLEVKGLACLVECSKSLLHVWRDSPVLQARCLVAQQLRGQGSAAARALRSGHNNRQLLGEVLRLLPPSFDCTKDLLNALLLCMNSGATDHLAALLLHFRTRLDEAGRLALRQAARDWATSTGNEPCLASLASLEAARSAGLDVNAGVGPDGKRLLSYVNYGQAGSVAVLLATEPSLDPSLPITAMNWSGATWLHVAVLFGRTDYLKTRLATPVEENDARGQGLGCLGQLGQGFGLGLVWV